MADHINGSVPLALLSVSLEERKKALKRGRHSLAIQASLCAVRKK